MATVGGSLLSLLRPYLALARGSRPNDPPVPLRSCAFVLLQFGDINPQGNGMARCAMETA